MTRLTRQRLRDWPAPLRLASSPIREPAPLCVFWVLSLLSLATAPLALSLRRVKLAARPRLRTDPPAPVAVLIVANLPVTG
jgi:hypothetical protein